MKRKLLFAFVFVLIIDSSFLIENCNSQWVQMSNGFGTTKKINCLASNGNVIFAGKDYLGIYTSTNYGLNWSQTSLNDKIVMCLAVYGNNLFAGTLYYGVYFSSNNGSNWTQTSLNNQEIISITINGANIFAGTYDNKGIYRSTNNGTNWTQTSLNNKRISALAINGMNIFAGTDYDGVYLSTNNGNNWTQTALNNSHVTSLMSIGNTIYAGLSFDVVRSTNNGTSWEYMYLSKAIFSLASNGNNIFAGAYKGVYLTTNNGTNWIAKNQGFVGNFYVNALLISNNYIFAGTDTTSIWRRSLTEIIGIQSISSEIPTNYSLSQNYPNPFNPITVIKFDIPKSSLVKISVFDITGKEIETLVNQNLKPGVYETSWNASNYSSGIYFCKIQAGVFTETKKMVLMK